MSFVRGLCEFSDLTTDEMNRIVNKFVKPKIDESERKRRKRNPQKLRSKRQDPSSLNYVDEGYVNPVVNQGLCGSCWR